MTKMPEKNLRFPRDLLLLYGAALLRAISVGAAGVVLGLHLAAAGLDPARIGAVIGLGLAAAAAGTFAAGALAERVGRRRMLRAAAALTVAGGAVFCFAESFSLFGAGAFLGMVSGMGRDRGAAYSLDQAILPQFVSDERRTRA
ncbi:MAG: MFS transporter, partial [Vicinamibacteria bacterium]